MAEPILSVRSLTKVYPGTIANNNISVDFYPSEVIALVGENGAGKSTFIKMLVGVEKPTSGEIVFGGRRVVFDSPRDAFNVGIAALHQELNLVNELTVAENIFLGSEIRKGGKGVSPDTRQMVEEAARYLKMFDPNISPLAKVKELSSVQKEIVQICQALVHHSEVILFDEPTAALEESDVQRLFDVIKQLKSEGKSILYVSHKLSEVIKIADRAVVLRNGFKVGELRRNELDVDRLVKMMAGRDVEVMKSFSVSGAERKQAILRVEGVSSSNVRDISFELYENEILGFAGLVGSGRSETIQAILGLDPSKYRGDVFLDGRKVKIRKLSDAVRLGIAYLPEERKSFGILPTLSIKENISILLLRGTSRYGMVVNRQKVNEIAEEYKRILNIKVSDMDGTMTELSGGNQQKVIIARCLATNPRVLILDEPTRGVDVETKAEIYELMRAFISEEGKAIIMISSELDEVVNMSDRIVVMYEGRIVTILDKHECSITKEDVVSAMSGNVVVGGSAYE